MRYENSIIADADPTRTVEFDTLEATDVEAETRLDALWHVILYNDDVHTFDEVIGQLMRATSCSSQHAEGLAWQVHTRGKATAFEGQFEECFLVQSILREIELITELRG